MGRFSTTVHVNSPIEHTYRSFLDENLMEYWVSGFKRIEILRGEPRNVNSMYKMLIDFQGEHIEVFQKILKLEEHRGLMLKMDHPQLITYSEISFKASGKVTELVCKVRIVGKNLKVKLAMPFVKNILQNRNNKDYKIFKEVVEATKMKN